MLQGLFAVFGLWFDDGSFDLHPGEVLYLPAFWWHEVETFPDESGLSIGVNHWYHPYLNKDYPCPVCPLRVNTALYSPET